MQATPTRISLSDAQTLLAKGDRLHVVVQPLGADPVEETWPVGNVLRWLGAHGAYLAGQTARQLHHGLCSPYQEGGWVFVETAHG